MSYEPLHHKYRPQTFADLVGQEAIATTLTNAIVSQRIAPAYLLTGPRGTGKTSSARILAKSLNCLASDKPTPTPCGKCDVCQAIARGSALDINEIDAASNTGVDNIREIIERSQFAPVQCRYKVYAIDECHMLSQAAFNALLKTLEEPPERVIFILATTDPQRVLPTIISRCQRFDFRRIPLIPMVAHLKYIAERETIDIDNEAIALVAQIANGGLRDAQSLLDQLSLLSGRISADRVWDLVGSVAERDLLALLKAIASDKAELVIEQCRHLMDRGREPLIILQNLASFYLNLLIAKTAPKRSELVAVTSSTWQELCQEAQAWDLNAILRGQQHLKDSETQLKNTTQPRLWLEVTLLGLLPSACQTKISVVQATQPTVKSEPAIPRQVSPPPQTRQEKPPSPAPAPKQEESPPPAPAPKQEESPPPAPKQEESPPPTPAPKQEEPIAKPASVAETISHTQIWQDAIDRVPPFTQTLLSSYCHLLSLEGNVARIGVKAPSFLNVAKGKHAEIEAAFRAVSHRPIVIHLQVATAIEPNRTNGEKHIAAPSPVQEPEPTIVKEPAPVKSEPTIVKESSSVQEPALVKSEPTIVKEPLPIKSEPPIVKEPSPVQESEPIATNNDSLTTQQSIGEYLDDCSDDEVSKAAASLAKCFEGEIVSLDSAIDESLPADKEEEEPEETIANNEPEISQPSVPIVREQIDLSDDEDDIPF